MRAMFFFLTKDTKIAKTEQTVVWNSSPVSIRESQSLPTFRRYIYLYFTKNMVATD